MKVGVNIKAFKNGKTGISRYLRSLLDRLQKIDVRTLYPFSNGIPEMSNGSNSKFCGITS